jgi:hypothetical protein
MELLTSAELMNPPGARWEVHDEIRFLIKTIKDRFRLLHAALILELSETLFTCLAQLYLATPFGL